MMNKIKKCSGCDGLGFVDYAGYGDLETCDCAYNDIMFPIQMYGNDSEFEPDKQSWCISHAETISQNVIGQIVAFFILWVYGITGSHGIAIQVTFLIAAYIRGYAIRRWFESKRK